MGRHVGWAWRQYSYVLMRWAAKFTVRRDVRGAYSDPHKGGKPYTVKGEITDDGCSKAVINEKELRRHFQCGPSCADVIGLHALGKDDMGLWCAADIDYHGPGEDDGRNERFAIDKYEKLRALGFRPLLTTSNGRGGYHLRVLFDRRTPGTILYALAKWIGSGWKEAGLDREPDLFPPKPTLDGSPYGLWLRLPGRHPKRAYWSKVWDGQTWTEEEEAVHDLLSITRDDPAWVTDEILRTTLPPPPPVPVHRDRQPTLRISPREGEDDRLYRARKYAAGVGNRGQGGRNKAAYAITAFCLGTLGLSADQAFDVLSEWNLENQPPLDPGELTKVFGNAAAYKKNIPDSPPPPKQTKGKSHGGNQSLECPKCEPFECPKCDDSKASQEITCGKMSSNPYSPSDQDYRDSATLPLQRPKFKYCPRCVWVPWRGTGKQSGQVGADWVRCWTWTCEACRELKQFAAKKDLSGRICSSTDPLWTWTGPTADLPALTRHLQRLKGDGDLKYGSFRKPDGTAVLILSHPTGSPRLTLTPAEDAIKLGFAAIDSLESLGIGRHPFAFSKGWKRLDAEEQEIDEDKDPRIYLPGTLNPAKKPDDLATDAESLGHTAELDLETNSREGGRKDRTVKVEVRTGPESTEEDVDESIRMLLSTWGYRSRKRRNGSRGGSSAAPPGSGPTRQTTLEDYDDSPPCPPFWEQDWPADDGDEGQAA